MSESSDDWLGFIITSDCMEGKLARVLLSQSLRVVM